jgi:acyl-CoA synthetase (AMP-forming)/AMP-acid ligase II
MPLVLPVAKKLGILSSKIYVLVGKWKGYKSFSKLITDAQTKSVASLAVRPAAKDTLAYLVFSSGTTGLPKGAFRWQFQLSCSNSASNFGAAVMISHGNIAHSLMQQVVISEAIAQVHKVNLTY